MHSATRRLANLGLIDEFPFGGVADECDECEASDDEADSNSSVGRPFAPPPSAVLPHHLARALVDSLRPSHSHSTLRDALDAADLNQAVSPGVGGPFKRTKCDIIREARASYKLPPLPDARMRSYFNDGRPLSPPSFSATFRLSTQNGEY